MADILNMKKGYSELADLVDGAGAITELALGEGRIFYLNPSHTNASDQNTGNRNDKDHPFATFAAAEDALTADRNDILVYVGGDTSLTLSAAVTWDKDYTHFIGVCADSKIEQRARIFQLSTLVDASPLFTVSANGCSFINFYIFQGVDDTGSLINFSVTGERNAFHNVHFAGGGHATQAINGGASLKVTGSANRFVGCTAGVDTIPAATGMVGILFDGQASRNTFQGSDVTMYAGHTGAAFVEVADGTGIDRYTTFRQGCQFINSNSDNFLMASGFLIPAFAANNSSRILVDPTCMIHGTSKLDADDRGVLFGGLNAYTGADASGVAVELKT